MQQILAQPLAGLGFRKDASGLLGELKSLSMLIKCSNNETLLSFILLSGSFKTNARNSCKLNPARGCSLVERGGER